MAIGERLSFVGLVIELLITCGWCCRFQFSTSRSKKNPSLAIAKYCRRTAYRCLSLTKTSLFYH